MDDQIDATSTALHLMPHSAHTGPRKYRKRPVVVDAVQMNSRFMVRTLEGVMSGKAGDYLVVGIQDERYPCDAAIFEASYEIVDDDEADTPPAAEADGADDGDA